MGGSSRKYAFFAMLTVAVCTLALYIHRHKQGRTGYVDNILISILGGFQQHTSYFLKGTKAFVDHYFLLVNMKQRYEEMQRTLEHQETKLAILNEVERENERLREALSFREQIDQPLLAAHVISHDVSSDYFAIRVDRGKEDGVKVGLGVISPSGVVGRILRVSPHYSDVLTIIDPTSNVDAVIQRSRARGIVSGQSGQLNSRLKYVDRLEDVKVADVVVSTGFGSIFPKGLIIGKVTALIPSTNSVLQTVTIKSAVNIYRLEEVFIVFPPKGSKSFS